MQDALRAMGAPQVVLRKGDGAEILRRIDEHGVTLLCGAPAVVSMVLDAAASWAGPVPGHGRVRIGIPGPPPPTRPIDRAATELGWLRIQNSRLTQTPTLLHTPRTPPRRDTPTPPAPAPPPRRPG